MESFEAAFFTFTHNHSTFGWSLLTPRVTGVAVNHAKVYQKNKARYLAVWVRSGAYRLSVFIRLE